jgi:hypothetical protein
MYNPSASPLQRRSSHSLHSPRLRTSPSEYSAEEEDKQAWNWNKPSKPWGLLDPSSKCFQSMSVVGPPSSKYNSLGSWHTVALTRECRYPFRPSGNVVVCCGPHSASIPRACAYSGETDPAAPAEHIESVGLPSSTAQDLWSVEPESDICSMTSTPPYFFSSSVSDQKLSLLCP